MSGTVIRFPLTPLAKFRRELAECRSERMIDSWCDRLDRALAKGEIERHDYAHLLDRSCRVTRSDRASHAQDKAPW